MFHSNIFPSKDLTYYTYDNAKDNNIENNSKKKGNDLHSWTLDSGTTFYMSGDLNCLSDTKRFDKRIYFANVDNVKSSYIGTYKGYVKDIKITLKNALYVPLFKKNLISIDCLSDQYYKTIFQNVNNKNQVTIYNKKNNKT